MKPLLLLLSFVLSTHVLAERFQSKLYDIDRGAETNQDHILYFENGRVAFLRDESTLKSVEKSLDDSDWLEVEVDETFNLISIQTLSLTSDESNLDKNQEEDLKEAISFKPTIVTPDQARRVFLNMRKDYQDNSQCYNRAHVWAFEEFERSQMNSIKMFLFFTRRYIRNYRYKWWFHVSPMAFVNLNGQVVDRVLDRRFTRGPMATKAWTDLFIYSRRNCPVVRHYSEYRNNQEKEDCYLIPTSMYFWQPADIERYERTGYEKTNFIDSEVRHSYWEAF